MDPIGDADDIDATGDVDETGPGRSASRSGPPVLRSLPRVFWRTIVKAWDDSIFGMSAQAAFWQTLSLPPLLLGLLGSLGYVGGWFGPDTLETIRSGIVEFAGGVFSDNVVDEIITPTVNDVLARGRGELISLGFVLSLWSGSSAMSSFVDSINKAHDQHDVRNAVWQRVFALNLYIVFLVVSIFMLPLVALGPTYINDIIPDSWHPVSTNLIDFGYYPAVGVLLIVALTTLYRISLPKPLPWHRLVAGAVLAAVVFWCASAALRVYLGTITKTGYSYGALATPIAFLLFTFFLGFAIVIGAQFNAAIQATWPSLAPTHVEQVKDWVSQQTTDLTDQLKSMPKRMQTGPIRKQTRPPQ
ncbi:membrane protein [Williamsia maris]|uniref:Membrane protein n=1 Tax=Williamsia maris TaxID=72806 RepID=A0ABT1HKN8_9NOCA|nr:membrane protein [Williamsia maris]